MAAPRLTGSRLCVKNLPRHATEARVKEAFSSKGEVTDVKILKTKDGRSRQLAFVGFRSADDAQRALQYFHRSFLDTSRLVVEPARGVSDGAHQQQRPWSKYSKGSSAHDKKQQPQDADQDASAGASKGTNNKKVGRDPAAIDDPKLAEFLEVMQPRLKSRMWANDDVLPDGADLSARHKPWPPSAADPKSTAPKRTKAKARIATEESDDDNSEADYDRQEVEAPFSDDENMTDGEDSDSEEEDKDVQDRKASVSDLDYLRSKVVADDAFGDSDRSEVEEEECSDVVEQASSSGDDEAGNANDKMAYNEDEEEASEDRRDATEEASPSGVQAPDADDIGETGRLFLRNLPYSATEDDLRQLFVSYGELSDVHLVLDRETRKSKGLAYVMFVMPVDAVKAAVDLDATDFQGRLLHIIPAKMPLHSKATGAQEGSTSYWKQKEEAQKANAGNRAVWNTLFMRPDTVAEAIAAHFGVSKSDLLDRDTADLPVRMALGETHVIATTKRALGDAGVNVEALEAAAAASGHASSKASVARSQTCLLVKNLPYAVTSDELMAMFETAGPLARLVLTPTRTIALVEYLEAQDARRGFKSLAYKRCHHVPLYLEWAPQGIFSPTAPKLFAPDKAATAPSAREDSAVPAASADASANVADAKSVAGLVDAENDAEADGSREVYVKNLNFETRDKALRAHFESAVARGGGRLTGVKVALKDGKGSKKLSLGYGFIECDSEAAARAVISTMQGSTLDGHKLVLQLSTAKKAPGKSGKAASKAQTDESKTKLVVRNVAFEATRKDMASLFSAVGQLKSLRLPKKFDGGHRGFAFAEFVTQQEAQSAIDTISGTHLYGRRLVVERAKEADGLEDIREKTGAKFSRHSAGASYDHPVKKKRKTAGDSFEDLE